jgi:tetratricopeptide (TPR) repeat protein
MASKGSGICLVGFDEQQKFPAPTRNTINELFEELSSCISFIEQQTKENKAVILITTTIEENILQTFESLVPIEAILVLSTTSNDIDTLPSKVIGVYPQMDILLRSLPPILDRIEIQLIVKSFVFNREKDGNDNLNFYFYNLWKNYTKDQNTKKKTLIDQARLFFQSNNQIKSSINDFETSYRSHDVLSWLDKHRHPFPYYNLIFNALRTHNQEILSFSHFFLNDLNKQMKPAPSGQVYLGTKLPSNLIDELEQQIKTDIIAFQCFLPVTRSRATALFEATQPTRRHKMSNVLFKIDLNNALCAIQGETIFIDISTPFHVLCITRSTGTGGNQQLLTIIKLIALDKHDKDQLFEQFIQRQQELGRTIDDLFQKMTSDIKDDETLADEHIARSEWSQAATILSRITNPNVRILNKHGWLLHEHLDNLSSALECHQQALLKAIHHEKAETLVYLGSVYNDMKQYDDAFKFYSQALQLLENEKKRDLHLISRCLVGLGNTQWARQQLDDALHFAERALKIREKEIKPRNDFDVAACLGNIGNILHDKGDIQRALTYTTRAVDIMTTSGKDNPRLAAALNNIGAMHQTNGNFVKAREYFERALEYLPNENHSHRKSTLANLAQLDMIEKSKK